MVIFPVALLIDNGVPPSVIVVNTAAGNAVASKEIVLSPEAALACDNAKRSEPVSAIESLVSVTVNVLPERRRRRSSRSQPAAPAITCRDFPEAHGPINFTPRRTNWNMG